MKRSVSRAVALVIILTIGGAMAQSPEPKRKTFHVTEVSEAQDTDACYTGACIATLIRVSGFVKTYGRATIHYALECEETTPTPQNKTARVVCARVEAGEDYEVKIYPSALSFWGDGQRVEGAIMAAYNITSQKEAP